MDHFCVADKGNEAQGKTKQNKTSQNVTHLTRWYNNTGLANFKKVTALYEVFIGKKGNIYEI